MDKPRDTYGEGFNYCPYCENERDEFRCEFFQKLDTRDMWGFDTCMPIACMCPCAGFSMKPGIEPPLPFYDPRGVIAVEYANWKERTAKS